MLSNNHFKGAALLLIVLLACCIVYAPIAAAQEDPEPEKKAPAPWGNRQMPQRQGWGQGQQGSPGMMPGMPGQGMTPGMQGRGMMPGMPGMPGRGMMPGMQGRGMMPGGQPHQMGPIQRFRGMSPWGWGRQVKRPGAAFGRSPRSPRLGTMLQGRISGLMKRPEIQKMLGITDEQRKKAEELHFNRSKAAIEHRSNLQLRQMELSRLLRAETPDRAAIDKKLQEIAKIQADQMRAGVTARLDSQSLFTKEQREKMGQAIQKLMQQRSRRSGPQPGAQPPPAPPREAKPKSL